MSVLNAWLATNMMFLFVWGSTFGLMWSSAKKSRPKLIGMVGTILILVLSFLSFVAMIWFSVFTGETLGPER